MKRIALLVTVGTVVGSVLVASGMSVGSAQEGTADQADVRAPWSKAWDLSEGQWYFSWYRWCYDPAYESSWYTENSSWEWGEKANLCPESGKCTISPEEGMIMTTDTP